jgi:hypothetical protein
MRSPFVWGKGGRAMTPEEVARQRELVAIAQAKMGDTSPVGHWTQGATRVVDAIGGVLRDKRATKAEAAGMAGADAYIQNNPVLAALIGGGGGVVAPVISAGSASAGAAAGPPPVVVDPAVVIPGGPLAGAVVEAPPAAGGHDHATHAGQTHGEWLKYSNQGATRNDPIDPALVNAMSFVGDMGITMDVISGGQEPAGTPGGKRTGSTRHDHGKSADVDFYKDGRKLDWNNPADLPVLTTIVQTAKANGVTGIGAGDDYMGAGRFHVGFGAPAVWGAGGSSANAPAWLVEAYNGAPAGTAPQGTAPQGGGMSAGGQPVPMAGGGADVTAALAAAMSDPWVAKKYGPVLEALMGQEMKRSDMQYQAQLAQSDPMYQAQLAQLTTPQAREPIEVGGVLLDPLTYEPIFDSRTAGGTDAPETQTFYDEATGQEYRAQWNGQEWVKIGGVKAPSGPQVEVNVGEGDSEFEKAFAKGDAATIETVNNAGLAAQRNLGRIDQLESILSSTPTGMGASLAQAAGEWGIPTEGLSEIQAAEALINSLVPEQRQPGSGPMSDADLALFKKSLPRIINQPGGNQVILSTMRAIAEYDAEGAAIVQRMRLPPDDPNYLDRGGAMAALQNRVNPLEAVKAAGGGGDAGAPPTSAPAGVDPAVWEVMTPEERALFQ